MALNKTQKRASDKSHMTTVKAAAALKPNKGRPFPIICIGGSAGAFKAIEKFFTHMPADSGTAFVVVMHLDKSHAGSIAELIQNFTPMPVKEAQDGEQVEPDKVYVIPRNKDMGIHNRKLLLLVLAKPNGYRLPIDYFLHRCQVENF
ncbi:MAG TPA: chemotaxis protein CheB [Mucilaginibacter sp.]|nr:chemotaxis protein CheB [Mucilaginibacter sp.]